MTDRFPDYDVLDKADTPSWNEQTREVIAARLDLAEQADVLDQHQLVTLRMLADRIVPQPEHRPPVNTVAILLEKIAKGAEDGYRPAGVPRIAEAWRRGLVAIDAEAQAAHGRTFITLDHGRADAVLAMIERGEADQPEWGDMKPEVFWHWRVIPDLVSAYYAHPSAWSAMGFGGPASPRGYVRLETNRRDPWEAAEQGDGDRVPASMRNDHVA